MLSWYIEGIIWTPTDVFDGTLFSAKQPGKQRLIEISRITYTVGLTCSIALKNLVLVLK